MNILGISDMTGNHSHSCAVLLQDGKLLFALSKERTSRIKNDHRFPIDVIEKLLSCTHLNPWDIDQVVCPYPPPLYYRSLFSNHWLDLPRSLAHTAILAPWSLAKTVIPNIRKSIFDPREDHDLHKAGITLQPLYVDHHKSHVAAAYAESPFDDCLGISWGGFAPHLNGKNVAGAVYRCQGEKISFLEDIPMPATGCTYSGFTVSLGLKYMQQESKVTALATLGNPKPAIDELYSVVTRFLDGKWHPYPYWVDYILSPRATVFMKTRTARKLDKWKNKYTPQDIAAAAQEAWSETVINAIRHFCSVYKCSKLALAGGTFLNHAINQKLLQQNEVDAIFIHPHTGDGSTPIGAALLTEQSRTGKLARFNHFDTAWGCEFSETEIESAIQKNQESLAIHSLTDPVEFAANRIAWGEIIGWYQGRDEYGPRAMGSRSILADPRLTDHRKKINVHIKQREPYLPLGISILKEQASTYLYDFSSDPFMTRLYTMNDAAQRVLLSAGDTTHRVRAGAVWPSDKPFRKLLEKFYMLTGIPCVLHSSLNLHGEPIVHTPDDAIQFLLKSDLDRLIMGTFSLKRKHKG